MNANASEPTATAPVLETGTGTLPAYTETLLRAPESARDARRLIGLALTVWGMDAMRDSAEVVVSELLTNAVLHARRESVRVTVTRLSDERVRVAVVDLSRKHPRHRPADPSEESGRGLEIVNVLSGGRWGVDAMAWGKRVWAELGAPAGESGE
ncbi:ATP-binding protein [Streptomyces paludis]|uniref:ATP-binding protein n=1 Tax=Streptomyces paludis TaxID=2282738 RepID=A0A345HLH5_9ACTN|nr:ATP-binding protein [Streptomyces paludis]AXG77549.1 ATP-binding protein [Streptomyces paludis]